MNRGAQSRSRNAESGYALITILFLLGVVAVMLARSLPRDAMAAARTREETLIYRGEQYARAVKLYFREHQRYPETLDDLEETDGVRFLRRRYRDPITGDDEWRLIKMGTDGRFEDSLVYDEPEPLPFSARHWLGAVLIDAERYAEAEQVYRDELADHPHNGWSLHGLRQALSAQGKSDPEVDRDFEESWSRSDVWIVSSRF